jgi:hypothetical protein
MFGFREDGHEQSAVFDPSIGFVGIYAFHVCGLDVLSVLKLLGTLLEEPTERDIFSSHYQVPGGMRAE